MEQEMVAESSMLNIVLKRKRSQRQRPLSDDALTMTTSSSAPHELMLIGSSSEEDQEVAKCLILLAQGEGEYLNECNSSLPFVILRGRKIDGSGLYECKTCNRFFHSFQALGGHRASHKKLKVDDEDNSSCRNLIPSIPIPVLLLGNNVRAAGKIRVHQCHICCAEFQSGQALGGHMRKHRVSIPLTHTFTTQKTTKVEDGGLSVTLSLSSPSHEEAGVETSGSNDGFQCLDLNIPAAASSSEEEEEDEISVSKFNFSSKQHQQSQTLQDSGLVLSGPALVDCHY